MKYLGFLILSISLCLGYIIACTPQEQQMLLSANDAACTTLRFSPSMTAQELSKLCPIEEALAQMIIDEYNRQRSEKDAGHE